MSLTQDPELQRLYRLNKHQLSDLLFLDDEVKFLRSLLERYFISMLNENDVNKVQLINRQFAQFNMLKSNITRDVLQHQGNLHSKLNSLLSKSIDFLKLEHERIEDEIRDLHKYLKNVKREIFAIYKDLHSEESLK